jgi:hypothetical protein
MAGIFRPNTKRKNGTYYVNFFKPEWKLAKNCAGPNASNDDF